MVKNTSSVKFFIISLSLYHVTVITVNFDQSVYIVDEDDGAVQLVLVLSNPSIYLINVQVNSTDGSAIGRFNQHMVQVKCNYTLTNSVL